METLQTLDRESSSAVAFEDELRAILYEEEELVTGANVSGETLDYVIITPQALFVLHPREWEGQIRPTARGTWRQRLDSDQVRSLPNPKRAVRQKAKALQSFVRAAFPSINPDIFHIIVLVHPDAEVLLHGAADPPVVRIETLRNEIDSLLLGAQAESLEEPMCRAMREALEKSGSELAQAAGQPFIFRTSGFFGLQSRAHTVGQVLRHIDRYPEDGIYHLWNGSLRRWFEDQGAVHLAELARQAVRNARSEHIALEEFLLATGMVARPRLRVHPRVLNLGYVSTGEHASMIWRLRKGRGRGYLYGTVYTKSPWVHLDPEDFEKQMDCTVTIGTESLSITEQPALGEIEIESNASVEPVKVPVRAHVRAQPSPFEVRFLRPLIAAILGGAIGLVLGWLLDASGFAPLGLGSPTVAGQTIPLWTALVGLLWFVGGLIRGRAQRPAWPIWYATARWLARTALWSLGLAVAVSVGYILALWLVPALAVHDSPIVQERLVLLAAVLAIIPAVIGEMRASRYLGPRHMVEGNVRRQFRQGALAVGTALLLVLLVAGIRFAVPDLSLTDTAGDTQSRLAEWLADQDKSLRELRDRWTIQARDRRAPSQGPLSTPATEVSDETTETD